MPRKGSRKSKGSKSSSRSKKGERKRSSARSRRSKGDRKHGQSKSDINGPKEKGKMVETLQQPPAGKTNPKLRSSVPTGTLGHGDNSAPNRIGPTSQDSTKGKNPEFYKKRQQESIPGPKYNCEEVTRFGPNSHTGPIISGRPKPLGQRYPGPGPGHYSPEQHEDPRYRTPSGARLLGRCGGDRIDPHKPAPGEYDVPSSIGDSHPTIMSSPSAAIVGRSWDKKKTIPWNVTPGPNQYEWDNNVFMKSGPNARLLGRGTGKTAQHTGPGPGAYLSDYVQTASSPSYSFGIKHPACVFQIRDDGDF